MFWGIVIGILFFVVLLNVEFQIFKILFMAVSGVVWFIWKCCTSWIVWTGSIIIILYLIHIGG